MYITSRALAASNKSDSIPWCPTRIHRLNTRILSWPRQETLEIQQIFCTARIQVQVLAYILYTVTGHRDGHGLRLVSVFVSSYWWLVLKYPKDLSKWKKWFCLKWNSCWLSLEKLGLLIFVLGPIQSWNFGVRINNLKTLLSLLWTGIFPIKNSTKREKCNCRGRWISVVSQN